MKKIEDMDTTIDLIIKLVKSIGATDRNIEDLKPFIEGIAYEKLIKGEIKCLLKRK